MANIEYNSQQFVNGEAIPSGESPNKKITLTGMPVKGNVQIAATETPAAALTWVDPAPVFTTTSDINFTDINVYLDDANPPSIIAEAGVYYATFGVKAEGNVTIDSVDYRARSTDLVKIKLLLDNLQDPVFTGTFEPFFSGTKSAVVSAATQLPTYKFGIKAIAIPATGKADLTVALVSTT